MKDPKHLKDFTDQHLIWLIQNNEDIEMLRLGPICAEILRRMNEKKHLFDEFEKLDKNISKYYFKGKCFDTLKDLNEFSQNWRDQELDQESAESVLNPIFKDIIINIFLLNIKFTNGEFSEFCQKLFEYSTKELYKK